MAGRPGGWGVQAGSMTWASFCFGMLFGSMSPVLGAPDSCGGGGSGDDPPCPHCFNCDLGLSTATLSWWLLAGPVVTIALGPLGGGLLDRWGHKQLLLGAGTLYTAGWAVYALTPGQRGMWLAPDDGASGSEAASGGPIEENYALFFIFAGRLLTWVRGQRREGADRRGWRASQSPAAAHGPPAHPP